MIFTSGTQAIQGRTVNHDPAPWLVTRGVYRGRYVSQSAIPIQHAVIRHDPRHEYAVLDNPILAAFRVYVDINSWHRERIPYGVFAREYLSMGRKGAAVWKTSTLKQVEHAIRVLEKLVVFDAR